MKTRTANRAAGQKPANSTTLVGWMGVTLEVPEGWSPVSVSGEGTQGYLKVVSPDTRYLEIKWEEPKGTVSVSDSLEAYFNRLRKSAKKSRQEIRLKTKPRGLTAIRPQKQAPVPYSWEADRKALGCMWHCGECNRMVIAEVVGELDDDLSGAAEILRSVHDHGADGWNTWSLYGLTIPAPAEYRVEKQTLMTGHQRFVLRARTSSILADRWGLAEIALRGSTLRQWFEARESSFLGRYAYRVEETALHGHAGLRFIGRLRLLPGLLLLLKAVTALSWPRFFVHGAVWECPETNRIYAVFGEQTRRSTLIENVVGRMHCHIGHVGADCKPAPTPGAR